MATIGGNAEISKIRMKEAAAPSTPASGYGYLYAKADGKLYFKDDAGTEYDLTGGGGGGGGDLAVIDDVLLSGDQVDVLFPAAGSLPTTHDHLRLVVQGRLTTAAASDDVIYLEFNGDTGNNYIRARVAHGSSEPAPALLDAQAKGEIGAMPAANATANYAGLVDIAIPNYRGTTYFKAARGISTDIDNTTGGFVWDHGCLWRSTAAITSIKVKGNFKAGTRLTLYGLTGLSSPRTT